MIKKIVNFVTFLLALIAGVLIAAAVTVWHLIPKIRKEERDATDKRIASMKETIQKAKAERTAKVDQAVAVVKEEAEAAKSQDTVDLANSLIASAGDE